MSDHHQRPDRLPSLLDGSVLLVWGLTCLGFFGSGRVASYLHPAFHAGVLASGIILTSLAALTLFASAKKSTGCASCHPEPGIQPGAAARIFRSALLTLPLLTALVISPSHFGENFVRNRGMVTTIGDLPAYQPDRLPGEDPVTFDVGDYLAKDADGRIIASPIDLLYAAHDPDMQADFAGKRVAVTGQYFPQSDWEGGADRFSLLRMYIMCCAADARPVALPVVGNPDTPLSKMQWITVAGTVSYHVEGGEYVPILKAESVTPCEPPEETFIY